MSKTIDVLKKTYDDNRAKKSFQDEIAKTYFTDTEKVKDAASRSAAPQTLKRAKTSVVPWSIASLALVLALIVVVSKSRFDVKIRVLTEVPAARAMAVAPGVSGDKGIFLVKASTLNADLVKAAVFDGDAKAYSRMTDADIILCNSKGSGWATYTVDMRDPISLRALDIRFTAKGARGDEVVALVIVDADNRSYRLDKDHAISLSEDWRQYTVGFKPLKNVIDLASIVSVRFEFGSLTAGNNPSATIFLKDICAVKARRSLWQ